jgi:penicillin-binding protein 1A
LNDWFFKQGRRETHPRMLELDSRLSAFFSNLWSGSLAAWNNGSSFFARFKLTGWKKIANELASSAFTMGLGGMLVVYTMALPAFQEFDEGRFLAGQYAVKFLDREGNEIGKRGILRNDAVPLEEIPDSVIKATMATEDRRFFEHFGIDVLGTMRALIENLRANDVVQGGSSLTQQLAKNLFLSSERSVQRKIKEMFLSFLLESRFTKREILKMYLDRAYMGGGAFGVEAAAQFYFGKSIRDVNLAEAALLAGLYKAPTKYAPHVNLPATRARTNEVLTNLVEAGFYTAAQVHEARLHPAKIMETRVSTSPEWFLDYAFEEVQRLLEGKNQYVLTVRTTVDLVLQKKADEALISYIRKNGRSLRFNSGALAALETDGAVRALVGGPDYGESQFNRATHAKRQPGSSFKVYVYATAVDQLGYGPETSVRDSSRSCGNWSPSNYGGGGGSGGRMPLWLALAKSLNTIATELSFVVGRENVIEFTKRVGIKGIRKSCSMALGDYGITPLEHTGGFASFANGGKRALPYAVLDAVNSKGDLVYSRERDEPPAPQVMKPQTAATMNQMMQKVVTDGTANAANLDFTYSAGKTGTSTGPKDVWFVGFTGKYVTGVWLGNDNNTAMNSSNTGGHLAAPLWHDFMAIAHTDMNIAQIPGLPVHPAQVAEQERLAELKRSDPNLAASTESDGKPAGSMPEPTRESLKKIAAALRKAGGLPEPVDPPADAAPPAGPTPGTPPPAAKPKDGRAQLTPVQPPASPTAAPPGSKVSTVQ